MEAESANGVFDFWDGVGEEVYIIVADGGDVSFLDRVGLIAGFPLHSHSWDEFFFDFVALDDIIEL